MSALSTWQDKVDDAKDRKDRIEAVLLNRQARVKFTRNRFRGWQAKPDTIRSGRKEAYWHNQFHKAVLGKREYALRERRIEKKIAFLHNHKPKPPVASTAGVSVPNAPWNPSKLTISNSLIPHIQAVWNAGWRGAVVSGYRSPAYQAILCENMCGNSQGCPGRCAPPGASNHQHYGPGQGAVDVTNYYMFAAVARRIGSPLHNSLGAQDPVHFSFTGR